ncbi:thioesterase family protein [Nocardia sp. NPDC051030]|uniref:acyl-CoA thioesterase n=1 Tax=Nocardia sp. NPDC051030 TaxID=3155162 RepID=UPI00341AB720
MTHMIAPPHPFDAATTLTPSESGAFQGKTSADYANMVGPFGGITAAIMLRAALDHPDRIGDPVSLTVNFAAPIADGSFDVVARPVRTSRSTQHWAIEMLQNDEVTTTATAVFGIRRSTWEATDIVAPEVPSPESITPPELPEFIAWVRNYEMRFVHGGLDALAEGKPADSSSTLWVRDTPPRPLDFPALAAMSDIFFPRVMLRLGKLVPAGTISMTVYFHATAAQLTAQDDQPVLATARALRFGNGFFDQSAELWTPGGDLLVTTHQMVYFKA